VSFPTICIKQQGLTYIRNVKCLLHCAANTKEKSSFSVRRVEMEIFVLAKALGSHTWRHQLFEIPIKPFPFSWHWNWKRHDGVAYVCDCVWLCVCLCLCEYDKSWQKTFGLCVGSVVTGERYYRHQCRKQRSSLERQMPIFFSWVFYTHMYIPENVSIFVTVSASLLLYYYYYYYYSLHNTVILFISLNQTVLKDYYYSSIFINIFRQ